MFVHSYVNYANIACSSAGKSKLEHRFQKHDSLVIYRKDWYTNGIQWYTQATPHVNDNAGNLKYFQYLVFNATTM